MLKVTFNDGTTLIINGSIDIGVKYMWYVDKNDVVQQLYVEDVCNIKPIIHINKTSGMKKYAIVLAGVTCLVDCNEPISFDKEKNRFHVMVDGKRMQFTMPITGVREIVETEATEQSTADAPKEATPKVRKHRMEGYVEGVGQ